MAASTDNSVYERGKGLWELRFYEPKERPLEDDLLEGYLHVSRDWYVVTAGPDRTSTCIANFPSQNVAAAKNRLHVRAGKPDVKPKASAPSRDEKARDEDGVAESLGL